MWKDSGAACALGEVVGEASGKADVRCIEYSACSDTFLGETENCVCVCVCVRNTLDGSKKKIQKP